MKDFKNMSDNTVLRVRVPKALYESIKKELQKENIEEEGAMAPPPSVEEEGQINEYVGLDPALAPYATAAGIAIPAAIYLATLLKDKALIVFKKMAEKAKEQKAGQINKEEVTTEESVKHESTEKE